MRTDHSTNRREGGSQQFQVCSVCHRWYAAEGQPWWDDRCSKCDEARQTRSHARMAPPVSGDAEDEVATEA